MQTFCRTKENKMEIEKINTKVQSSRSNNHLTEIPEIQTNGNRMNEIIKELTQENSPKLTTMSSEFMLSKQMKKNLIEMPTSLIKFQNIKNE